MIDSRTILAKTWVIICAAISCHLYANSAIDQVRPPWGYVFKDWHGPPLDIITYIPPGATKDTPVLIVVPGASRDAQRFHASWLDIAKRKHFSVLTIGASKKYFPDELQKYFNRNIFVYANVPYKIKGFSHILKDPKNTIDFDYQEEEKILNLKSKIGSDGALLHSSKNKIIYI